MQVSRIRQRMVTVITSTATGSGQTGPTRIHLACA